MSEADTNEPQRASQKEPDDRYVRSVEELLAASLPADQLAEVAKARNERIMTIASNNQVWKNWDIEYCYCSVFDECWQVRGIWGEPEPIKECVRDEPREFTPNS